MGFCGAGTKSLRLPPPDAYLQPQARHGAPHSLQPPPGLACDVGPLDRVIYVPVDRRVYAVHVRTYVCWRPIESISITFLTGRKLKYIGEELCIHMCVLYMYLRHTQTHAHGQCKGSQDSPSLNLSLYVTYDEARPVQRWPCPQIIRIQLAGRQ